MDRWIGEWCSHNFAAGSFHTVKLCSRRFSTEVGFYWQKQQNRVLCHPLGDLGVTYTVHLWLVGKRVADFLLVLIELFSPALTAQALWADIGQNFGVRNGVGHFERKFQGEGGSSINYSFRQKTRVTGLSRWRCLRDHTSSRFDTVPAGVWHTDTHTDTRWWLIPAPS